MTGYLASSLILLRSSYPDVLSFEIFVHPLIYQFSQIPRLSAPDSPTCYPYRQCSPRPATGLFPEPTPEPPLLDKINHVDLHLIPKTQNAAQDKGAILSCT